MPIKTIVDVEQCDKITRTVCIESIKEIPQEVCVYEYVKKYEETVAKTVVVNYVKETNVQMVTVCSGAHRGYGHHAPVHHAPIHHAPIHHAPLVHHAAPVHHAPAVVHHEQGPANYNYGYAVADSYSGVNFGATEARDGYATTGSYNVLLPDGRTQTVTYSVGDDYSGYVADVQYSGEPAPYAAAPAPHA